MSACGEQRASKNVNTHTHTCGLGSTFEFVHTYVLILCGSVKPILFAEAFGTTNGISECVQLQSARRRAAAFLEDHIEAFLMSPLV